MSMYLFIWQVAKEKQTIKIEHLRINLNRKAIKMETKVKYFLVQKKVGRTISFCKKNSVYIYS